MMSDAEVIKSSSVSTSTPTATSSIITRPVCALFGRLWREGIHVVTGLRSNMKQRLMPLYGKIMLRKRSIIETVNYMLKNVAQLVHTQHLLSTGNCKIINLSEENILWGFKI